jgi:glycosyltransferase involved in cell wall biosynthesis
VGGIRELLRAAANYYQLRYSRRVRRAVRAASELLVASSTNRDAFAACHCVQATLLPETGVSDVPTVLPRRGSQAAFRILWIGSLHSWKGLSLLIRALALLPRDPDVTLRVVGDGPLLRRYQRLAEGLEVGDRIRWLGRLPCDETLEHYRWADVLVFSSLRDTSGNVILEALSHGVPVICLDHQAAKDMVTAQCGIRVPVTRLRKTVWQLAGAIHQLSRDPNRQRQLAAGALLRARQYQWSRQAERMNAVYARALARFSQAGTLGGNSPRS